MQEMLENIVVTALDDLKAQHIKILDVRSLTYITDTMIIATGTSNRHVKALADKVIEAALKAGIRPLSCEGLEDCEWVLVDLGDILVHIMQPRTRDYYYLEGLWDISSHAKNGTTCL
jgi:ribosome-associated protein